jgi:hypothetical protein
MQLTNVQNSKNKIFKKIGEIMPKHMLVMLIGALLIWLSACTVAEYQLTPEQLASDDNLVWEAPLAATIMLVETVARSNKPYFEFPVTTKISDTSKSVIYSVDFTLERHTNPIDSNQYSVSVFVFEQAVFLGIGGKIAVSFSDFIGNSKAPDALLQALAQLRRGITAAMDATYKRAQL